MFLSALYDLYFTVLQSITSICVIQHYITQ